MPTLEDMRDDFLSYFDEVDTADDDMLVSKLKEIVVEDSLGEDIAVQDDNNVETLLDIIFARIPVAQRQQF